MTRLESQQIGRPAPIRIYSFSPQFEEPITQDKKHQTIRNHNANPALMPAPGDNIHCYVNLRRPDARLIRASVIDSVSLLQVGRASIKGYNPTLNKWQKLTEKEAFDLAEADGFYQFPDPLKAFYEYWQKAEPQQRPEKTLIVWKTQADLLEDFSAASMQMLDTDNPQGKEYFFSHMAPLSREVLSTILATQGNVWAHTQHRYDFLKEQTAVRKGA